MSIHPSAVSSMVCINVCSLLCVVFLLISFAYFLNLEEWLDMVVKRNGLVLHGLLQFKHA